MMEFIEKHQIEMDVIRAFPFGERRAYAQFLAQTRHYVVHTTRLLGVTASRIGEEREPLHVRFMQHAAEEKSHHRLAEHDLRKLGLDVSQFSELPVTKALYQTQYYRVEHEHPTSIFGYIFALEGLAVTHGAWIYESVVRAHGKEAATFVKLHAEDDVEHMAKTLDAVSQLPESELSAIRDNYLCTVALYRLFLQAAGAKP
jgi:thiaminase